MAIALLIVTLLFAGSSVVVPFGGFDPDAFPVPQDNPPVQPEGYAFAIWGVIYLWLIVSAGFGVWKRRGDADWDRARLPLLVSLGVGIAWLPVASRSPEWATVLIWIMLGGALLAAIRAPARDPGWFALPVGLYAGWLTAASSVSIGLLGAGYGIAVGQTGWALIAIAVALGIVAVVIWRTAGAWTYAAAVVWALVGIVVGTADGPIVVAAVAGIGAAVVAALAVIAARRTSDRQIA